MMLVLFSSSHPLPLEAFSSLPSFLRHSLVPSFVRSLVLFLVLFPFSGTKTNPESIKLNQMLDSGRDGACLTHHTFSLVFSAIGARGMEEKKMKQKVVCCIKRMRE